MCFKYQFTGRSRLLSCLLIILIITREEEERARADREAAAAAEYKAAGVRKRRGFVPPVREGCLLDPADEPEGGPVVVAVRQVNISRTCLFFFLVELGRHVNVIIVTKLVRLSIKQNMFFFLI